MGLPYQYAVNGREARGQAQGARRRADQEQKLVHDTVGLVLTDAEMPEMDGYVLTRHIKEDKRFEGIPVLMHSSLSSVANQKLGQQVGVTPTCPSSTLKTRAHARVDAAKGLTGGNHELHMKILIVDDFRRYASSAISSGRDRLFQRRGGGRWRLRLEAARRY